MPVNGDSCIGPDPVVAISTTDVDGRASYLLHCERSSGRYLLDSLLAAGADLGAQLGGSELVWPERVHHRLS